MRIDTNPEYTTFGALEAHGIAATIGLDDPDWSYRPTRLGPGQYVINVYDGTGRFLGVL